ncbi:signal peptidase II [Candidatus Woesearchaeota archaeon]|nr:signal peptidase II [Candidatus Woesearchaeota archaeon]
MVKKLVYFFLSVSVVVILFDQLTKYLILTFQPQWSLGFFSLHLVKNTGAGFGILQNQSFILGIVSFIAALGLLYYYPKIPVQKGPQFFSALLLGGIVGNMLDRIFRSYVIDFLDFSFWPAFNIADSCITIAVIGLVFYYWKNENKE